MGSKLQFCQLKIQIYIYKLMCHSSLINSVSFVFCEFNRVGTWNESKTAIIISKSQIEKLVSYSRSTYINVSMCFPNSNFEGNFSNNVFHNSFWRYRELKIDCLALRQILCDRYIKFFLCVDVRILVEKWKIYAHIFPR